jgi:serine phosphatase RsbU (regulator of sigma subunit)
MVVARNAQLGVSFFYVIPVALATWWVGWRVGLAFGAGCLGLFLLGTVFYPVTHFWGALAVRAAVMVFVVVAVGAVRDRVLKLEHSAEELEAIRMALAPPAIPVHAGVDAAAAFIPSELGVSGDFYLLTTSPDGSSVAVVGDVVGHGPKAARLATFIRARLATFAANSSDPAEILTLANQALLERPGRSEELVSAICLRYQAGTRRLSWALAGHPPPLALPGLRPLAGSGPTLLLGVEPGIALSTAEETLDPTTGVLAYTDGATDLRVEGEEMLGLEGFTDLLGPISELPAADLVREVESELLERASGSIKDDICILAVRPAPIAA